MGNYGEAWVLVVAMAIGGGTALWFLLRTMSSLVHKSALVAATVLIFVTPASVPRFEDAIAPAFIVAIFEGFFQIDGSPRGALVALGLSLSIGVLLTVAVAWRFRAKKPSGKKSGKKSGNKSAGKQDPVAS